MQRQLQTDAEELDAGLRGTASSRFAHDFSEIPIHPLAAIQTRLAINTPLDEYELEADRVSEQVMRMPEPRLQPVRPCGGLCPNRHEGHDRLQIERVGPIDTGQIAIRSVVQEVSAAPGQPLDPAIRRFMEPRFGYDFSQVRVHTDTKAAESARAVNARAYTLGPNVVFGSGQLALGTYAGRRLLAHELTHVVQQGARGQALQRSPEPQRAAAGDLQLPWKHGDYSLFEVESSGIRFLVAVSNDQERAVRAAIPAIGKQMSADNSRIKDSKSRVTISIIASTTTRFALWRDKSALALDPSDVNVETAAHEMGHAIFYALKSQAESKAKDAPKSERFRLIVSDIYARLSQTKEFTEDEETHPAGLWIADPSQWAPGSKKEHPWRDPDEFFASAKTAYQINRKGFESAIARFKKIDPKVEALAKELFVLLDAFFRKGQLPSRRLPEQRAASAKEELQREADVSKIEDTVISGTPLDWLLNPANRPKQPKAHPSLESPF